MASKMITGTTMSFLTLSVLLLLTAKSQTIINSIWYDDFQQDVNKRDGWYIYNEDPSPSGTNLKNPIINGAIVHSYHGPFWRPITSDSNDEAKKSWLRRIFQCAQESTIYVSLSTAYCMSVSSTDGKWFRLMQLDQTGDSLYIVEHTFENGGSLYTEVEDWNKLPFDTQLRNRSLPAWQTSCSVLGAYSYLDSGRVNMGTRDAYTDWELNLRWKFNVEETEFGFTYNVTIQCEPVPTPFPTESPTTGYPSTGPPTTAYPTTDPSHDPTKDPTYDPTQDPTTDPTSDPSNDPTTDPTNDPSADPTTDPTDYPTSYPTTDPTMDPTVDPTADPTNDPTTDPTFDPTGDPTSDPTVDPTTDPTSDPTNDPTQDPTFDPTDDPTTDPTADPTQDPTNDPSNDPTSDPTFDPTNDPTSDPSMDPTSDPTNDPTVDPTTDPTTDPTKDPTTDPTADPTSDPSVDPTIDPTNDPSSDPTTDPTRYPTFDPIVKPTKYPTTSPTIDPTLDPTLVPTLDPTVDPTIDPTSDPTVNPTTSPTFCNGATYFILQQMCETEGFTLDSKSVDCPILLAGESIISQNCVYLLKLEETGNLLLQDMDTENIIWQTNTLIYNNYPNGIKKRNLQLFMSNSTIFLIEDKYPGAATIRPKILWQQDFDTFSSRRLLDEDLKYQLIVKNDGNFVIISSINNRVMITRGLPTATTVFSNATVIVDETDPANTNSEQQKKGDDTNESSNSDGLIWLWILLACFFAFCIGYTFYLHRKNKGKEINMAGDIIKTGSYGDREDSEDTVSNEGFGVTEDDQIAQWMNSTTSGVDTIDHISTIEMGDTLMGGVNTEGGEQIEFVYPSSYQSTL